MNTGEWKQDGQIFTLHDTKGYLKDIQTDLDYVPEKTGENLDSLVRTNAFWCFLEDDGSTGLFKTILYRRTVENKILTLGGESSPERTTRNSMRAFGDYVYFLPKVKESQMQRLTEAEKGLCDKLFRMIPGRDTKELIAEQVDGYLVLDDMIYYSQAGKIHSATSGREMATGEARYSVVIRDDNCYLVDEIGNPAVAEDGSTVSIGDRDYRIEEDGLIRGVKHGQLAIDGKTYYLGGSGTNASVNVKQEGSDSGIIREPYGVQSFCIVDNQIYYSSYVEKTYGGEWYSQIFKTDMGGQNKQAVSGRFPGAMENMYYYEDEAQIYGEYHPANWKQAYGVAAIISLDGNIYRIKDASVRTGKNVDGNDMLEIVMARDGKVICMWKDCTWNRNSGITGVVWSKAVELNASDRVLIDMAADGLPEESSTQTGTDAVVQPIGTPPSQVQDGAPSSPSGNYNPPVSTNRPGQENAPPSPPVPVPPAPVPPQAVPAPPAPAPTKPPVPAPPDSVQIVPIG